MLIIIVNLAVLSFLLTGIYLLVQGAIYVPSRREAIEAMLYLAKVRRGERAADLGSGDGRVMAAFAGKGAFIDGFEVNPLLVWRSRNKIKKLGNAAGEHNNSKCISVTGKKI